MDCKQFRTEKNLNALCCSSVFEKRDIRCESLLGWMGKVCVLVCVCLCVCVCVRLKGRGGRKKMCVCVGVCVGESMIAYGLVHRCIWAGFVPSVVEEKKREM